MSADTQDLPKVSPMMQQWHQCKKQSKEAILFFRMGDFYEAFYDDAVTLANELGLTLTKRQDIPMSGVPVHTCAAYVDKLVTKGFKVAIAEQLEDPKLTKGIVKRGITRFVTPGTVMDSGLLKDKSNNFLVSAIQVGKIFGLSFIDISTGEFSASEWDSFKELLEEVYRLSPSELLLPERFYAKNKQAWDDLKQVKKLSLTVLDDWRFDHQMAYDFLIEQFKVHSLDGFGFKGKVASINASGSLGLYITESLCLPLSHVQELSTYTSQGAMLLDQNTQKNLELTESLEDRSRKGTLLDIMDTTKTPMGGRLLCMWIRKPLIDVVEIQSRLDATSAFIANPSFLKEIRLALSSVRDLERLVQKIHSGYASPRDLVSLKNSLKAACHLKALSESENSSILLKKLFLGIEDLEGSIDIIERALMEEPPLKVSEGGVFKDGFHEELDELRDLKANGNKWLINYQESLREEAGIKTLKVGFNRVFGYYIEVSRGQAHLMPENYVRRQTLANNERFISPELKEYEEKVLNAEEKIGAIESRLFQALREEVIKESKIVIKSAKAVAMIDALASFANNAISYNYVKPHVDDSLTFEIKDGRHPVVEALSQDRFIPNDALLNGADQRLLLLTGPNMAGKSTFIRQIALIAIMAQMGSFVPASEANIGICDKVFTRIGASDNLAKGQSTFMVEMTETANILNNATDRSLVILDEIGRGTSTYDGISIAWSVAEYLLTNKGSQARTLFATHYWELTQLESKIPGAVNYNVAVRECSDRIVFLRKIIKGGTDKSYGIHVAKLAGLPAKVIQRADELLAYLEEKSTSQERNGDKMLPKKQKSTLPKGIQLSLF